MYALEIQGSRSSVCGIFVVLRRMAKRGAGSGPDGVRMGKEMKDTSKEQWELSGVRAEPRDGDFSRWIAWLRGPVDTPYQGGLFELDIEIPSTYPFDAPKIKFVTQIWHPNISSVTVSCTARKLSL